MTLPLMDLAEAQAARDVAIARGASAAVPDFTSQAFAALCRAALGLETLIVDDVWRALGQDEAIASTHDRRVMGSVMQRGLREGVIRPTMQFRPSAQKQCHANPRRVWESMITSTEGAGR